MEGVRDRSETEEMQISSVATGAKELKTQKWKHFESALAMLSLRAGGRLNTTLLERYTSSHNV